ncbi:MAG: HAMP domain-containing sensor histidine kinase [Eubacteriales bacterium]|nr:HAMP domain-containing sensor histidine kinase [Eubacteriales bacterium]
MKRLTLQWRITLLTALVLAACSIALTAASIVNADRAFVPLLELPMKTVEATAPPTSMVVAGVESTPAQLAKQQFSLSSILFCVVVTAAGTTAAYLLAGKALRPLRELTNAVEAVNEKNLSHPLPTAAAQDEVGILTANFNRMLHRLDDAFLRQKRFTANAAHELKTPLATLKTGVQVLKADRSASLTDYQDHAEKTLHSVDRLSRIVDDLLLLASASDTARHDREEVMLEPLFEAIQDELVFQLESRRITCTAECGELTVTGNPAFLYRIFFNLMENACKYGHDGGHIWIHAARQGNRVSVLVQDDGPGISPEHLPYIFDAFYRVDKSRSREMGGSGLGLSLVKTMVEAEGGSITAQSDGTTGTSFVVTLPV